MIPPHLFYQIYLSFLEQNDCTPPECGELSDLCKERNLHFIVNETMFHEIIREKILLFLDFFT